jgi:hypothetical protein
MECMPDEEGFVEQRDLLMTQTSVRRVTAGEQVQ